ncbi:iron ABC transporter permease [Chloroflexia bacterium SDU3-3]|nr:iron ABC transporter permease [Chloroflexia bacterium SDU3-3]
MLLVLAAAMLVSIGVGAVQVPPAKVLAVLLAPGSDPTATTIVWDLRLARVLLAALIGAALASSGAAFQGLFRNPLADPYVIGAAGGAALGATIAIVMNASWQGLGFSPVPLAAFIGSLAAVALVYAVAEIGGSVPPTALLLAGTALGTLLSAAVSLLMMLHDQTLQAVVAWLLGGLGGRSWPHLVSSGPYMLAGIIALWLCARPLDALAFGEETARSLGLSIGWMRVAVLASASLATAAAVAVGGIIGFVGLIAPHIARRLVGSSHARLVPASAMVGALLLLLADDFARTVLAPTELPVGIVTALLGGPFFLYLLKRRGREVT